MITLAEAKLQLNIDAADTTHDVELQSFADAAIVAVEKHTGMLGAQRTITDEPHTARFAARLWLDHKPVQSLTSVTQVDGTQTWNVANLPIDVDRGVIRVISGPLLTGLLKITYQAGHVIVPTNMNLAARIIVQHLWETQRGAMGTTGVRGVLDDSVRNLSDAGGRGYAIPTAALELLGEPVPVIS